MSIQRQAKQAGTRPPSVLTSTTGIRAQELVLCNPLICCFMWLPLSANHAATYLDCSTAHTEVEGWIYPSWLWVITSKPHPTIKFAVLAHSWYEVWGFPHIVHLWTFPALPCVLAQCRNSTWDVLQCHQATAGRQDLLCSLGIHSLLQIHQTSELTLVYHSPS